ncbi:MAG: DUF3352 domain-containing protein [Chloroflexota bacterium]
MSDETTPPAPTPASLGPSRPSRRRWTLALLVTGLIVALSAGLLVLVSSAGAASRLAGWVPADTYGYAELRLEPPGDQGRQAIDFLARFPGFADRSQLDAKLTDLLDRLAADATGGRSSYSAVKPWLGDALALAVSGPPPAPGQAGASLVVAAIRDPAAARRWLDSTVGSTGTGNATHGGVELIVGTAGGQTWAAGVVDTVLLAGERGAVEAAIDSGGRGPFGSSPSFRAALASLGGDSLAVAYLEPRRVVGAALGALPAGPALDGILTNELPAWTGLAVRAHGDALEVLLTSPALESGRAATNRPSTLVSRLPATTLVAAEAHDLGLAIGDLVKRLGADPRTADAAKQLELALGTLGGLDSFTAWMGDGALVVTGQGGMLDGGLVVSVVDEAAAAARLASLRSLLSLAGGVAGIEIRDEPYGAGRITSIDLGDPRRLLGGAAPGAAPLPAGERLVFAWTLQQGVFVLGLGDPFVKQVIDTPAGMSLAESPRYRDAIERAGSANAGQIYVDLGGLIESSAALLPAAERARYEQEVRPFLEPLGALTAAGLAGDPIRVRFIVTTR